MSKTLIFSSEKIPEKLNSSYLEMSFLFKLLYIKLPTMVKEIIKFLVFCTDCSDSF